MNRPHRNEITLPPAPEPGMATHDAVSLGFCAGLLLATVAGAVWAAYTGSLPPFQAVAAGLGGALASILAVGMVRAWWLS